jgi:ribosomal protein S27AE
MECTQCGGSMMAETVIKLRRSLIGLRETRSSGAYCPRCKIGVPMEARQTDPRQPAVLIPGSRKGVGRLLPPWRHAGVRRSGHCPSGAMTSGDSLSLARQAADSAAGCRPAIGA